MKESYDKFTDNNIDLTVVLQSDQEVLKEAFETAPLPFEVISDPECELYKRFEIEPASSKLALAGGIKAVKRVNAAKKRDLEHGKYEGNELQLPAIFIIDDSGTITYAKYAKSLSDAPTTKEILELLNI